MTYKGHIENGMVVLDENANLPDGALVTIQLVAARPAGHIALVEHYRGLIGALDGFPEDWSENHDTYLKEKYGA